MASNTRIPEHVVNQFADINSADRSKWLECARCRKPVDEIRVKVEEHATDFIDGHRRRVFYADARCHDFTEGRSVDYATLQAMRAPIDMLSLLWGRSRRAFVSQAAPVVRPSQDARSAESRRVMGIGDAVHRFAELGATPEDFEEALTGPRSVREIVDDRRRREAAERAPGASQEPPQGRPIPRGRMSMSSRAWGASRDGAGTCRVCLADDSMWCDEVAHRQASDRDARDIASLVEAGLVTEEGARNYAGGELRDDDGPPNLAARIVAARDALGLSTVIDPPFASLQVEATRPVPLTAATLASAAEAFKRLPSDRGGLFIPRTIIAELAPEPDPNARYAVEWFVATVNTILLAWTRARNGAAILTDILFALSEAWAKSPTLLELDLEGRPAVAAAPDDDDAGARTALLEPYNTKE